MERFGYFISRKRRDAKMTQEQLAEKMDVSKTTIQNWERGRTKVRPENLKKLAYHLSVSEMTLMSEMTRDADDTRTDRFPYFLFEEDYIDAPEEQVPEAEERAAACEAPSPYDTIGIIRSLHLNWEQQEMFGLLCLYAPEIFEYQIEQVMFQEALRRIPYAYIEKVGSIHFMNLADGLYHVLRYVDPDFLLKVLKLYPEDPFDVTCFSKELIIDFLDEGWLRFQTNQEDEPYGLNIKIDIRTALDLLPILADIEGEICLCEGDRAGTPLSDDVPQALKDAVERRYGELVDARRLWRGLYGVTDLRYDHSSSPVKAMLSINEKGRKLVEWYQKKE